MTLTNDDLLMVEDPNTGQLYQTTAGEIAALGGGGSGGGTIGTLGEVNLPYMQLIGADIFNWDAKNVANAKLVSFGMNHFYLPDNDPGASVPTYGKGTWEVISNASHITYNGSGLTTPPSLKITGLATTSHNQYQSFNIGCTGTNSLGDGAVAGTNVILDVLDLSACTAHSVRIKHDVNPGTRKINKVIMPGNLRGGSDSGRITYRFFPGQQGSTTNILEIGTIDASLMNVTSFTSVYANQIDNYAFYFKDCKVDVAGIESLLVRLEEIVREQISAGFTVGANNEVDFTNCEPRSSWTSAAESAAVYLTGVGFTIKNS